jgi:hypothetical protein
MSNPLYWDTSLGETEKRPPLKLGSIPGVLDYAGHRSPLSRSNTSHKVSMALPTPATQGVPRIYHFESAREMAVALEALLSPDLYELEVQLPPIPYVDSRGRNCRHSFDLRVTFRSGFRRAIFAATSPSFADDKIVVNGDGYTRGYRDNLLRVWRVTCEPDPDADGHVLERARSNPFWTVADLVAQCDMPCPRVFNAVLRLVGARALGARWTTVFCMHSRLWLL